MGRYNGSITNSVVAVEVAAADSAKVHRVRYIDLGNAHTAVVNVQLLSAATVIYEQPLAPNGGGPIHTFPDDNTAPQTVAGEALNWKVTTAVAGAVYAAIGSRAIPKEMSP